MEYINHKKGAPLHWEGFYCIAEIAELLCVSKQTVRNYMRKNHLDIGKQRRKTRMIFYEKQYIDDIVSGLESGKLKKFP